LLMEINQEKLKIFLSYDSRTGNFTWLVREREWFKTRRACSTWNTRFQGTIAGHTNPIGYLSIGIQGRLYWAHRLAWLFVYGEFPENYIDHINHDGFDNRISNLRSVTCIENQQNRLLNKNNTSGVVGVFWSNLYNKWKAQIYVNGKQIYLGIYYNFFEAVCARKSAQNKYGFHPNHGSINPPSDPVPSP